MTALSAEPRFGYPKAPVERYDSFSLDNFVIGRIPIGSIREGFNSWIASIDVTMLLSSQNLALSTSLEDLQQTVANAVASQREAGHELRINELRALRDGWDGPGSLAPTPATLRNASAILRTLPRSIPDPDIVPISYGSLELEWENARGSASIDIGQTRFAATVALSGEEPEFFNGTVTSSAWRLAIESIGRGLHPAL